MYFRFVQMLHFPLWENRWHVQSQNLRKIQYLYKADWKIQGHSWGPVLKETLFVSIYHFFVLFSRGRLYSEMPIHVICSTSAHHLWVLAHWWLHVHVCSSSCHRAGQTGDIHCRLVALTWNTAPKASGWWGVQARQAPSTQGGNIFLNY